MKNIGKMYEAEDAARSVWLQRSRAIAALTMPAILPWGQYHKYNQQDPALPQSYQSDGSRIITNLTGKILTSVFPIGRPWMKYSIDPRARSEMTEQQINKIENLLYLREIMLRSAIESSGPISRRRGHGGFQSIKRTTLSRLLITGDALEYVDDDLSIRSYRNDMYVTKRDSSGNLLWIITKESIDPLSLPEEQQAKLEIKDEDDPSKRMEDIYTLIEWNQQTKKWLVKQEIDEVIFNEFEKNVNPWISSTYELLAPDHYGRGFVELQIWPDLKIVDILSEYMLDFAALASTNIRVIDQSSNIQPEDLVKRNGSIIKAGRVSGGQLQDVGWLKSDRIPDFSVVQQTLARTQDKLGKAGLLDSQSVRRSERTTAFEVQNVTLQELNGALGGVYAALAYQQQIPLIEVAEEVLSKSKGFPKIPKGITINTVTGLSALNREADARRSLNMLQIISNMDPQLRSRINEEVLLRILVHDSGIDRPDLILTEQQFKAKAEAAAQAQAQAQASQKAIDVTGNIAQSQATQ